MIFISVGSQKFQFNRLLKEIDLLIKRGIIKDKVFAQIGVSDYKPKYYNYIDFLTQDEFNNYIKKSNLIITHAGTSSIISSLKENKKVIVVPRLSKYKEHVDDHQIQLTNEFETLNLIEACYDIDNLMNAIENVNIKKYNKYISNSKNIIESIEDFLDVGDLR